MFFVKNIVLSLLLTSLTLSGQSQDLLSCLDHIYRGDFTKAKEAYTSFPITTHHAKEVMEIFCLRWEEIPIQFSNKKDTYIKKLNAVAAEFKKDQLSTAEEVYLHITLQLLLSEYYFTNNDFLKALWHAKKAYPLISKSFDDDRKEPEFLFVKGLYLYYIDFYKQKNFYYRGALWPFRDGNKKEGLLLLKQAASTRTLAQTEALIYLAHIYLHLENKPLEALPFAREIAERYPQNSKFRELYIDNLIAAGLYGESAPLLDEQLAIANPYYKIPALYFSGCLNLSYHKNSASAKKSFNECIAMAEQHNLLDTFKSKSQSKLKEIK